VKRSTTLDIDVFLPIGHPGTDTTTLTTVGITLDPRLHSISPNVGSLGGTMILAEVQGLGTLTEGVTLVTSTGVDLCQSVTLPAYGQVLCLTKEGLALETADTLQLKIGSTLI